MEERIENPVTQPVEEVSQSPQIQEEPQLTSEEVNLQAMRKLKLKAEQERDVALNRLKNLEDQSNDYEKDEYAEEEEEEEVSDFGLTDDDFVEGKHLSKVAKKIRKLEKQVQNYEQKTTLATAEARLKIQYPDFDKVVSKENIELLSAAYPEIANTLNSGADVYSTAVSAYTIIKQMGIHKEDPYVKDKATAAQNFSKPKPLASVSPQQGDSALSQVNAFTGDAPSEERKAQLRKQMEEAVKYL